jgi:type VI protein secretion system component VasK
MEHIVEWWTRYQGWAGNLDAEARLFIMGACVALLMVYMVIEITAAERAEPHPKPAKSIANKGVQANRRSKRLNREQSRQ